MSSRDYFSLSDLYHVLDETTALEPIDDVLGTGLPLISFQSLGSMLFAEDRGVPARFHTAPEFLLRPGGHIAYVVTEDAPRSHSSRPAARIDDDLIALMRQPIDLPSRSSRPTHTHDAPSYGYDYGYASSIASHPSAQPPAHRRHHSASGFVGKLGRLIPPHHGEHSGYGGGLPAPDEYDDKSRRYGPSGHAKRPSYQYQLPPPLPSAPFLRHK